MANRSWLHVVSPILYAAVVPLVAILVIAAIAVLERTVGLHTLHRVGDIDAAIALAFGGATLFSLATHCLAGLEHLDAPGVADHVRHSALLYVLGALTCIALIAFYSELNGALQYAYLTVLFSVSVFGIFVNAANLAMIARRNKHAA